MVVAPEIETLERPPRLIGVTHDRRPQVGLPCPFAPPTLGIAGFEMRRRPTVARHLATRRARPCEYVVVAEIDDGRRRIVTVRADEIGERLVWGGVDVDRAMYLV